MDYFYQKLMKKHTQTIPLSIVQGGVRITGNETIYSQEGNIERLLKEDTHTKKKILQIYLEEENFWRSDQGNNIDNSCTWTTPTLFFLQPEKAAKTHFHHCIIGFLACLSPWQ